MKPLTILILFLLIISAGQANAIEIDEFGELDLHGYISQGYLKSNKNNYFCQTKKGDTDFYEVGVSVTTEVTDNLRMGVQLLSNAMGNFGNTDFHVNWANGDYYYNQWLGIKAGKIKIYHGLYNRNRDADFLRTNILLPQSIYNEAWRSSISSINGMEIYGNADINYIGRLRYSVQAGKVSIDPEEGVAVAAKEKLLEKDAEIDFDIEDVKEDFAYIYNLLYITPVKGLILNTSLWTLDFDMVGTAVIYDIPFENAVFETSALSVTTSMKYNVENLTFISEYSYSEYDFKFNGIPDDLKTEGYYANIIYRFTDWFETGIYYSVYYPDRNNRDGERDTDGNGSSDFDPIHSAWQKDSCLTFRFDLNNNWVMKLEGHLFDGTAVMMKKDNTVDYDINNIDMSRHWFLLGAKITYSF